MQEKLIGIYYLNQEIFFSDTSKKNFYTILILMNWREKIFNFFRHFIVLIASTPLKDQYMDWVRLVESKMRLLVHALEKNQYINLVHINPQGYEDTKET
jgi:poly(A) polymerase Pap1